MSTHPLRRKLDEATARCIELEQKANEGGPAEFAYGERLDAARRRQNVILEIADALVSPYCDRGILVGANLRYLDIRGLDFRLADLSGADLSHSKLPEANLNGAKLVGANLYKVNLVEADLGLADFSGANLAYTLLTGCSAVSADFSGANLSWAEIGEATLRNSDISRANLSRTALHLTCLEGVDFSSSNIEEADLEDIWEDVDAVLQKYRHVVPNILQDLKSGKIDGAYPYEGLSGSIRRATGDERVCVDTRATRAADLWFSAIRKGETPDNNPVSKLIVEHIKDWLASEE
jgi:uncharacterized protein YjbI with pentapeptide repeats